VEICEIWAVGARADAEIYSEAAARAIDAAGRRPELRRLAEVVERLGRLTGNVVVPVTPIRDPVPGWLARRLIDTVGMTPQDVAALSLEQAVDIWGEYRSADHGTGGSG
jgi:mRNA interferase RelE/StbE